MNNLEPYRPTTTSPKISKGGCSSGPAHILRRFKSPPPHHTYFIRKTYLRETYRMESMSVLGKADHSYQARYGTIRIAQPESTTHLRCRAKWEKNWDESNEVVGGEANKTPQHCSSFLGNRRILQSNHDN